MKMTANLEYNLTIYWPMDRDEEVEVYGISNFRGTEKEMIQLLNQHVGEKPFVNQVWNLTEMRACYKVGFRPYGEQMSYQQTVEFMKKKGSICMTINI
ncbi:hypothetical protein [Bacillus cereus]|uniref:hypothetical protein n=1 Tax=Bacillus cereus group TaxID=86661 RepID=UPI00240593EF|nr:hypothetical protein [Bacillus cereus]MDF9530616.1 hypothetical protein [Bacillus cereus]MDG1578890.1 hypothetical protein [Bacillus cereus]